MDSGVFMRETLAEIAHRDRSADRIDSIFVWAHHCAVGIKGAQQELLVIYARGDIYGEERPHHMAIDDEVLDQLLAGWDL